MNTTIVFLLAYILILFTIAYHFSKKLSLDSFFVNARSTNALIMTFSLITTIIGTGATIVVISEVNHTGISYGLSFLISATVGMTMLGFFAHRIKQYGDIYKAFTIVDFFGKRFDRKNRYLTGILQLIIIFLLISIQATAISTLTAIVLDVPFAYALAITALITILYTTVGGFKIDILTDFMQFWVLAFIFIVVAVVSMFQVHASGGYLAQLPPTFSNPIAYGGIWWFLGTLCLSGFAHITNASHWQRILSAKTVSTAKTAFRVAIPVVLFLSVIIIILGLSSHILIQTNTPENTLFSLMKVTLPLWSQGIAFAAIISILISSLDTLVISGATISYGLFFKKYELSQKSELLHARLITAIFGLMGYIVAALHPHIVRFASLSTHISLIFAPPVVAAFTAPRISANAIFYSLLIPSIILIPLFPVYRMSTFLITTPLSILILVFYDSFFKRQTIIYKQKKVYHIR